MRQIQRRALLISVNDWEGFQVDSAQYSLGGWLTMQVTTLLEFSRAKERHKSLNLSQTILKM